MQLPFFLMMIFVTKDPAQAANSLPALSVFCKFTHETTWAEGKRFTEHLCSISGLLEKSHNPLCTVSD